MNSFDNNSVSVIIPVYNSAKHLAEAINSALGQTYKNIEIVLVDDCSTDDSVRIIKEYSAKFPNIVYHYLETNSGAAVARNKALQLAKGRYVAFLDSDDIWYPQKTQKQLTLAAEKDAAFCFSAIEIMDDAGRLVKPRRDVPPTADYAFILKNTVIATSTVLIDRKVVGTFEMPLIRSGQDYAAWLQLLRNGMVAYGSNEALTKYRRRAKSLSSNKLESIQQVWRIQTENEGIGILPATINTCFFIFNAFRKHFL